MTYKTKLNPKIVVDQFNYQALYDLRYTLRVKYFNDVITHLLTHQKPVKVTKRNA